MKVAIIGQNQFGKAVLNAFTEKGHEVAGVFCAPEDADSAADPMRVAAQEKGLAVFQLPNLTDAEAEAAMKSLDADLAIMAFVLQFAPQRFVNIPRLGTIQYHPSLLPRYRGPSSINWPIVCGETETGLTIFRPTDGMDEGPVILQKKIAILPGDTLGSVYFDQLFPLGVQALLEAAELVFHGKHAETEQDEAEASYDGWFRTRDARIQWDTHVDLIYNLIRGSDPAPGAWTTFNGEKLCFFAVKKHRFRTFSDMKGQPGEIVEVTEKSFKVAALGGLIEVFTVRPVNSKKQAAMAFFAERHLRVGQRLGS